MAKPRRQTYTLEMYLKKMKDQDIRSDQDVQRMSGAWNNNMVNELITSVLNDEYIPPIILGAEKNSQMWIIDGLQRSTALMMFRYGKYKVTPSIEEPVIPYRAKVMEADGEACIDGNGDIVWEDREFDLRNKTYDRLPEELKKAFDEYQVETVVHENYDMQQISRLVRRFNFNKGMSVSQRAFTFCDKYARKIREILKMGFFIEAKYTKAERKNGTLERVIMETAMFTFHLDNWKKSSQIGAFLNENASMEEFEVLESDIMRLENIITEDSYSLFTSKDSFILFTLFHKFTKLNTDDGRFADFLAYFKELTAGQDMNEFYGVDKNASTKDKNVILKKLDMLETLMLEYLGIPKPEPDVETDPEAVLTFVRANVVPFATKEDIEQYMEVLDSLLGKANCSEKLLEAENKPSLVAIVSYSFENDIDLDDWIVDYCSRNRDYVSDQKENYLHMKDDLEEYLKLADVA